MIAATTYDRGAYEVLGYGVIVLGLSLIILLWELRRDR